MEKGEFTIGKIYVLKHPISLEIRYCGQTIKTLKYRLNEHIQDSKRYNHHTANWIKSLLKQGLKPVIELIEECETDVLNDKEIYYIAMFRKSGVRLTNIADGGQTGSCKTHSEEAKEKISTFMKSYKKSAEHIENMRKSLYKTIYKYELSGEFIKEYSSAVEAAQPLNADPTSLKAAARREGCSFGFQWRYFKQDHISPKKMYFKDSSFSEKVALSNKKRSKKIQSRLIRKYQGIHAEQLSAIKVCTKSKDIYELITVANGLRDNLVIYLLGHVTLYTDVDGNESKCLVTNGRKLEKIKLETKLPVVLFGSIERGVNGNNKYYFETQSNRSTAKTPLGMFDEFKIPNSLKLVDNKVREYYEIK